MAERVPEHVRRAAARLAGDGGRPCAAFVGSDGSGRTETLDALVPLLEARELTITRITARRADRETAYAALEPVLPGKAPAASTHGEQKARDAVRTAVDDGVLVLDDAHWLDDHSLHVLAALADEGVGIVVTHRPAGGEPLEALDAALARTGVVVRPEPLDDTDVAERATRVLGEDPDPVLVDELVVRTGGHPRFVDALAKVWREAGTIEGVPAGIDQAVAAGGALTPRTREALDALALGTPLDDDLLASLVGIDVGDVRALWAELRAAGLLLPGHDEPVPLVADVVGADLDPAERRDLHRRIAELLTERGAPAAHIAEHLLVAGVRTPDAAVALLAAGEDAIGEAPQLARVLLQHAVAAGADAGEAAAPRAEAAALAGDEDASITLADDAIASAPSSPAAARAAVVLGGVLARRGLWARAEQSYARADAHPTLPPDALAGLAAVAAVALGRVPAPATAGTEPAPIAADVARALGRVAIAAGRGEAAVARDAALEAAELLAGAGTTLVLPETPHVLAASVAIATGDLDDAERLTTRALETDVGGPAAAVRHRLVGGLAALRGGSWDRAQAALDAVASDVRTTRDVLLVAVLRVGLARRAGDVGALHAAWSDLTDALAAVRGDLYLLLPLTEVMVAAGRLGTRAETRDRERELDDVLDALGAPALWARQLAWARVDAAVAAGDAEALDDAVRVLRATGCAHDRLDGLEDAAAAWQAVLAGAADPDLLDRGVHALERAGLVWEASRLVGQAAIRASDPGETRTLLGRARELKGTLPVVDDAGLPVGTVLSTREQEVAACVVDGLTHKEIGGILFISPKTVEHHVARIRQKLGASTRAEMLAGLRATLAGADR